MGKIKTDKFLEQEQIRLFEIMQTNKRGYIWRIYELTHRIGPGPGKGLEARRAKNKVAKQQRKLNRSRH